jgi:signal transduction histidine kinase
MQMREQSLHNSHVVLIIADDAAFPRDVLARWQTERTVPAFTVMSTELFQGAALGNFDLALIGPVRNGRLASILKSLDTASRPVICVLETAAQIHSIRTEYPRLLLMQQHESWLDALLLIAAECLKRVALTVRVHKAEQAAAVQARNAALGRYMMDNRHGFNNLLTSVLGNSELLLAECQRLPEAARDQLDTIHRMALTMHEIMQRFSSIAIEMQVTEKQSQDETSMLSHVTAGS